MTLMADKIQLKRELVNRMIGQKKFRMKWRVGKTQI